MRETTASTGTGLLGTGLFLLPGGHDGGDRRMTVWATLLYAPIVPLRTLVLRGDVPVAQGPLVLEPRTARFEVLSSGRPDPRDVGLSYIRGFGALAAAAAPLALVWLLLGETSLLAPLLLRANGTATSALAGLLEAFEGLLRLVLSAIWLALWLAALDLSSWRLQRAPRPDPAT